MREGKGEKGGGDIGDLNREGSYKKKQGAGRTRPKEKKKARVHFGYSQRLVNRWERTSPSEKLKDVTGPLRSEKGSGRVGAEREGEKTGIGFRSQ